MKTIATVWLAVCATLPMLSSCGSNGGNNPGSRLVVTDPATACQGISTTFKMSGTPVDAATYVASGFVPPGSTGAINQPFCRLEVTSRRQKGWLIAPVDPGGTNPEATYVAASTGVPLILNVVEMPWQAVAGSVTTSREPGLFPPLLPHELSMGRVAHTANHTVAIVFIFGSWFQLNCRIARPYICVAGTDEVPQALTSP